MKFGIMAPYMFGPVEDGGYVAAFAQLAEEMGFESVWAVEHVVMCPDYESRYPYSPDGRSPFDENVCQPDPLVWLTYVAAVTERIKLATGILILPQRNPVVLAKTLASIDRISGGRMLLGVGVGWVEEEARAVGTSFAERGARMDEYIDAMRALWREPLASFRGPTVEFDRVVSSPRPAQEGGVPIIIGGHSAAAARRAGRVGDGFYPLGVSPEVLAELREIMNESARSSGRDPAAIELTCVGTLEAESAQMYRDLGVHRMNISPPTGDLDALQPLLERFRDEVISG